MEDKEQQNNEQSFLKEQRSKGEKQAKERAKKNVRKAIITAVISQIISIILNPIIMAVIIVSVMIAGFLDIIGIDFSINASEAKAAAVTYTLGVGTGEDDSTNSTNKIKISYDNGVYTISNSYSNDKSKLNEIKKQLTEIGIDVSNFTDFEIGIIGALMENGLDIDDYTTEELKCLPLFIKAEACTRYLDLRPNSEKFDSQGNYQPQKLEDLKENEVPGVILVKRTNTNEKTPRNLEYIDLNQFNSMVANKNQDVLNYFTIDKDNNLLVAKWEYIKVEVDGEYPSGVEPVTPREEYIISEKNVEKIPYSEYVKKYTMPFDFLVQLLVISDEPDFCRELTNIANDSKIVINIQETETKTVEEDIQTYTVYRKQETTTKSAEDQSESQSDSSSKTTETSVSSNSSETSETGTATVITTEITHEYSFEIIEADTWLAHYIKEYKKIAKEESTEGPNEFSTKGKYGSPSTFTRELEDGKIEEINTWTKADETHVITKQIEKYPSDPNSTTSTDIYTKDENGRFEKFLSVYDKYAYTRDMMDSASASLFDMMEDNSNTEDLVDPIKYLLYVYDGTDHGVTEIDTSIFKPSEFGVIINSKGIIVKTDEPLAIKTLTRKEIEELINKNFTGRGKENLLSAIDGFMYIQDTYKVNAVFAIAVTKAESGCGTGWAAIHPSTHNWCSLKGSYNGNYDTDSAGTRWRKYSSFNEAIRDFGDWIATSSYYFKAERYTISDIAVPYCNEIWGETVAEYVKEMYESIGVSIYVNGGNDLQQKVVEVAKNSSKYGIEAVKGYCQAWVSDVYYRAGANSTFTSGCCAVHSGAQWGVSTDFSQIQVGATVYGYNRKTDMPNYGHVGIYIGDGMVAHNVGGVKIDDLDDWIKTYDGICWGWNGGTDLTGGSYPCKPGLMTVNH